jgi:hypothetical protein
VGDGDGDEDGDGLGEEWWCPVGEGDGEGEGDGSGVGVGVGAGVGAGFGVGLGVGLGVRMGAGEGDGDGDAVGAGAGVAIGDSGAADCIVARSVPHRFPSQRRLWTISSRHASQPWPPGTVSVRVVAVHPREVSSPVKWWLSAPNSVSWSPIPTYSGIRASPPSRPAVTAGVLFGVAAPKTSWRPLKYPE